MIRIARWGAIAIAVAAILDPRIPFPRSERPVVRVVSPESADTRPLAAALNDAGFVIDPASPEAATVLVGSGVDDRARSGWRGVLWALDTGARAPNVSITRVAAPSVRLPGQAIEVRASIAGDGVAGQTTEVTLEHAGIPIASAKHTWSDGQMQWTATLQYLPPTVSATTLRVRATAAEGETTVEDNAADLAVPAVHGPIRVLVVEAAVTWPAVFVRRALEGEPAVAVSSLQRAATSVATRAGEPPAALTRSTLAAFEAVVIGGPESLRAADLESLRWFVEQRGGVAIFVPDRAPSGRYLALLGVSAFTSRSLETPTLLGTKLQASEIVIPSQLPPAATVVAASDAAPIVFSARRGAGAIVFSGALDAWRHRGDTFGAFWRELLIANTLTVPPALEVVVEPAMVRPGERTTVVARVREIPEGDVISLLSVAARVVSPDAKIDEGIRLWPTAEPGVYEGEWRARSAGLHNITVASGDLRGDATVTVAPSALHASAADVKALQLAAAATGGRAFPSNEIDALVAAMRQAHPSGRVVRSIHPMRSPWWVVPFAGLLCVEWAVRRKRGMA
jgi:hypothetical protein